VTAVFLEKFRVFEKEIFKWIFFVLVFVNVLDFDFGFPIFLILLIFIGFIMYFNFRLNFLVSFTVFNWRWSYYFLFIVLTEFFLINNISLIMNFVFEHFEWLQYFMFLFIKKSYRFLICPIIIKPHNSFWGREKIKVNFEGVLKKESKIFCDHPSLEFNGSIDGDHSIVIGGTSILRKDGVEKKDNFFNKFRTEKLFESNVRFGDGQAFFSHRYKFVYKNKHVKLYKNMKEDLQKLINFKLIKNFDFLKFYNEKAFIINPFVDALNRAKNQSDREEIMVEFQKITNCLLENLTFIGNGSESLIDDTLITSRGINIIFEDDDLD